MFDDPRSLKEAFPIEKVVPQEMHKYIFFDPKESAQIWADAIGFRAPDVVGKISPEIKPGKYTYKDVQNNPAFQKLFSPWFLTRIGPGGPPIAGMIPEFEITETEQMFNPVPLAKATKDNMGKAKLDSEGYLVIDSLQPGYPFPRPEGEFKAQQYLYNWLERYQGWGFNSYSVATVFAFDKNLKNDRFLSNYAVTMRTTNRIFFPPYGDYDPEARKRQEKFSITSYVDQPRDSHGSVNLWQYYRNPDKPDALAVWVPALRRIRKVSGTDSQDQMFGLDSIMDDANLFGQKLSPTLYPYKVRVLEEREFLVCANNDTTEYLDTKDNLAFKGIKLQRRPVVVIEMVQQDPNYVYGKRVLYFDKETFFLLMIDCYNQKGELYRSSWGSWGWDPKTASTGSTTLYTQNDEIDKHVTVGFMSTFPAYYDRKDVGLARMVRFGK
ncbi:MAG: DUF1329 domain-containing protein [Desulfatitalea sp.]|nr:DUF1329 domain-containing protein [Desulfatitalea sp.]